MFPLRTDNPVHGRPTLTYVLIAANVAVFLLMRAGGDDAFQRRVFEFGTTPRNLFHEPVTWFFVDGAACAVRDPATGDVNVVSTPVRLPMLNARWLKTRIERLTAEEAASPFTLRTPFGPLPITPVRQAVPAILTLLTSMFMHSGWLHLLGNMWFLYLFGCSVEDALGKRLFAGFYVVTGLAASAAHVIDDVGSVIPCLGASGAISGVMGGFAVLFPRANILTTVFGWFITYVPAVVFLGFYLLEQIFMSVAYADMAGGVAWWAHIGGFAAGFALAKALPVREAWRDVFRRRRRSTGRRWGYEYEVRRPDDITGF